MSQAIGERIKSFRSRRGMTRKELCAGICDESTLLRIETGKHEPKIYTIQQLCKRLEIPISYIIQPYEDRDITYLSHIKKLCREFVYHKDFKALEILIKEIQDEDDGLNDKEDF